MQPDIKQKSSGVSASLTLVGFGMHPEAITESLGIEPFCTDERYVTQCGTGRKEECGLWSYNTGACVPSCNLGEHLEHLLRLFRPLKSRLEEMRPLPNIFVHVKCNP